MNPSEPLVGGREVLLRHPTAADEDAVLALQEVSRELHEPWQPVPEDGSDPVSAAAYARFLSTADTPQSQKYLICRRRDSEIVGYVGLSQIHMGSFCSAYMGYWMGAPHVGNGYATEGVRLCLERAFRQLGLHRVEANIIPANHASRRVVEKCGFRREGYSPRYLKIAGKWQDHERWAITIEDWLSHSGPTDSRSTKDA